MRVAILLAAGSSRRFGRGAKLLALFRGKPLLHHAIDRARASGAGRVLVVTGAGRARIGPAARAAGLRPIFAREHHAGMGASLQAGLRAVRPIEREILIFLADMPFATASPGWRIGAGLEAVRPIYDGVPGHPLLVRTTAARRLVRPGDQGFASGLPAGRIALVNGTAGSILDIDDRAGLRRARSWTARR